MELARLPNGMLQDTATGVVYPAPQQNPDPWTWWKTALTVAAGYGIWKYALKPMMRENKAHNLRQLRRQGRDRYGNTRQYRRPLGSRAQD